MPEHVHGVCLGTEVTVLQRTALTLREAVIKNGMVDAEDVLGESMTVVAVVTLQRTATVEIAADGAVLPCGSLGGIEASAPDSLLFHGFCFFCLWISQLG